MMNFIALIFGWMPFWLVALVGVAVTIFMVIGALKLIKKILDAIPFV